jgi:hypothetical protein
VTLEAFGLLEGERRVLVPSRAGDDPAVFVVQRRGDRVTATGNGSPDWRLLLVGVDSLHDVAGGSAEVTDRGMLVTPADASATLQIVLPAVVG